MRRRRTAKTGSRRKWPPNPYPGLRPFLVTEESDESLIYFGRQSQTYELVDRLRDTHFMAVLGPSGCGKSSLVRAGLMPALSSGLIYSAGASWEFAELEPGRRPIRNLAAAIAAALTKSPRPGRRKRQPSEAALETRLRGRTTALIDLAKELPELIGSNKNLFILVDQFEEIFRHDLEFADEDAQFINLLLNVFNARPRGLYVVLTMRTDFLEQCATFHGLPEALNDSQFLTPRLNEQQLEDAIAKPLALRHYNGSIEPELVRCLLSEMTSMSRYDPDLLPLMQHALFWLWRNAVRKRRKAGAPVLLKLEDYERLAGDEGLQGVLSQRADQILHLRLKANQRPVAERMFRLLSEVDENARRRRRVTTPREVAQLSGTTPAEVRKVANKFTDPNVSFVRWKDGRASLDVTHESLIRKWKTFDNWCMSEGADAAKYLDFRRGERKWREDQGATLTEAEILQWEQLLRGKPNAELWAARYGGQFSNVSEFVEVSKTRVDQDRKDKEERERLRQETLLAAEKQKRSRVVTAILSVLAGVAVLGWVFAWLSMQTAEESAEEARLAQKQSEVAREEAAESAQKARFAHAEAEASLKEVEENSKKLRRALGDAQNERLKFEHELGRRKALSDVALKAIALRRASIVESEVDEGRPATALRLALDARKISTSAQVPYNLALARAATAAPRPGPELQGKFGNLVSAQWSNAGWTALWANGARQNSADPDVVRLSPWASPYDRFVPGAYLPGANLALVTRPGGAARIVSETAKATELERGKAKSRLKRGVFSADGKILITLASEKSLRIWDVASGRGAPPLLNVDLFALSKDDRRLVTASISESNEGGLTSSFVRVWNLRARAESEGGGFQAEYSSHAELNQIVKSLGFGADGTSFFVGLGNGELRIFNETESGNGTPELKQDEARTSRVFGTGSTDNDNEIRALDVSSDGTRVAVASSSGKLNIAQAENGQLVWGKDRDLGRGNAGDIRFGPDGNTLLVSFLDHIQLIDLTAAGEGSMVGSDGRPVSLSPDGSRVLTISGTGPAKVWNATDGEVAVVVSKTSPGAMVTTGAFSPDGGSLALGYEDGTIQVIDTATGQAEAVSKAGGRVWSIFFDPTGKRLVSHTSWRPENGPRRRGYQVWDAMTGELVADFSRERTGRHVGFSPDGRWFHIQVSGGLILIWDLESRRQVRRMRTNIDERIRATTFVLPAGKRAELKDLRLAVSTNLTTTVWDVATGQAVFVTDRHPRRVRSLSVNVDASLLMAAFAEEVWIWRLRDAEPGKPLKLVGRAGGENIRSAIFDPGSRQNFVVFSQGGNGGHGLTDMVYWTSTRAGRRARRGQLELRTKRVSEVFGIISGREQAIAWRSAQNLKALSFYSQRVRTWRMERSAHSRSASRKSFALDVQSPYWANFTPDGGLVVHHSKGLSRFEKTQGESLSRTDVWGGIEHLKKRAAGVSAGMSPDRKFVVAPTSGNSAIVVDAKTGELVAELDEHASYVNSARFSHLGDRIMTTSADGTARLWEFSLSTRSVKLIRTFDHNKSPSQESKTAGGGGTARPVMNVLSGAFHSSGDFLVTASDDGFVAVWNTKDDSRPVNGHRTKGAGFIYTLGFAAFGECVFFESGGGKVEFRNMRELKSPCPASTNRPAHGKLHIEGFRLLNYRPARTGEMAIVTGMAEPPRRGSVLALYNRNSMAPLAVWKDPLSRFAGWANWSADKTLLAVPFGRGKVRILHRPSHETWEKLLDYSERAAKPSVSERDRKRLQLTDIVELVKLAN